MGNENEALEEAYHKAAEIYTRRKFPTEADSLFRQAYESELKGLNILIDTCYLKMKWLDSAMYDTGMFTIEEREAVLNHFGEYCGLSDHNIRKTYLLGKLQELK